MSDDPQEKRALSLLPLICAHPEDHLRAIDHLLRNAFMYLTVLVHLCCLLREIKGEGYVQTHPFHGSSEGAEQWRKSLILLVCTTQGGPIGCSPVHSGNWFTYFGRLWKGTQQDQTGKVLH